MQPMDEPYPSDWFATIFGITNHEVSNKHIKHYYAISSSKVGYCLCIYPEHAQVFEQPTSIHSMMQLQDFMGTRSLTSLHCLVVSNPSLHPPVIFF